MKEQETVPTSPVVDPNCINLLSAIVNEYEDSLVLEKLRVSGSSVNWESLGFECKLRVYKTGIWVFPLSRVTNLDTIIFLSLGIASIRGRASIASP